VRVGIAAAHRTGQGPGFVGHHRILVVEDEPLIRELIVDFLTGEGLEATSASNGREAIEIAVRERPDLILLDMMLPLLDGTEVVRELRKRPRTRSIRIIAMSADSRILRAATSLSVDDVLPKPFNLLDLLDLISAEAVEASNHH
jgi:CheY-like chemotaxis protein